MFENGQEYLEMAKHFWKWPSGHRYLEMASQARRIWKWRTVFRNGQGYLEMAMVT